MMTCAAGPLPHAARTMAATVPAISGLPSGELCGIAASMYASRCAFSPVTSTRPGGPGFRRRLSLAILLAHRRTPFDNDAAEREIRMGKLRIKVSGCMRSITGAQNFCAICSHLSTAAKHGIGILDALTQGATGTA